jgi:hypothetical protein
MSDDGDEIPMPQEALAKRLLLLFGGFLLRSLLCLLRFLGQVALHEFRCGTIACAAENRQARVKSTSPW